MTGGVFADAFCRSLDTLPGVGDPGALLETLDIQPPVSIRFNPYKVAGKPEGEEIPWCRYGFYLDQRPQFTLDPLFHGGAYYVQEASSMFVEALYRAVFSGDEKGLRILDLCASPGGKTTLLSTLAGPENLVVANEVIRTRAVKLVDNVKKWGVGNVAVTNNDPSHFEPFGHWFDFILVDAPCSGEGMFRKNRDARDEWSEGNVKLCASRGRRILSDIWGSLRPGGVLVLSTCTFNTVENEDTVRWLADELGAEGIGIEIDPLWGIEHGSEAGIDTFRFYPHRLKGEGFFAAAMRKPDGKVRPRTPKPRKTLFTDMPGKDRASVGGWFNQPEYMRLAAIGDNVYAYYNEVFGDVRQLAESLTVLYSGVMAGQLFHGKLKPEHSLAMFHDLKRDNFAVTELDTEQALDFLRKTEQDSSLFSEGMNLVTCQGLALGWIKRIGARSNNLYPKESRIINL